MTDPRAQPCRTCKWWLRKFKQPQTYVFGVLEEAPCAWPCPPWLPANGTKTYTSADSTGCPVWEPEAMPHG